MPECVLGWSPPVLLSAHWKPVELCACVCEQSAHGSDFPCISVSNTHKTKFHMVQDMAK